MPTPINLVANFEQVPLSAHITVRKSGWRNKLLASGGKTLQAAKSISVAVQKTATIGISHLANTLTPMDADPNQSAPSTGPSVYSLFGEDPVQAAERFIQRTHAKRPPKTPEHGQTMSDNLFPRDTSVSHTSVKIPADPLRSSPLSKSSPTNRPHTIDLTSGDNESPSGVIESPPNFRDLVAPPPFDTDNTDISLTEETENIPVLQSDILHSPAAGNSIVQESIASRKMVHFPTDIRVDNRSSPHSNSSSSITNASGTNPTPEPDDHVAPYDTRSHRKGHFRGRPIYDRFHANESYRRFRCPRMVPHSPGN